jgi:hypothetical protein
MPIYLLFVVGHMLSDLILNIKLNFNIFFERHQHFSEGDKISRFQRYFGNISLEKTPNLIEMEHNKAPRPHGFPATFYQTFWEVIKVI